MFLFNKYILKSFLALVSILARHIANIAPKLQDLAENSQLALFPKSLSCNFASRQGNIPPTESSIWPKKSLGPNCPHTVRLYGVLLPRDLYEHLGRNTHCTQHPQAEHHIPDTEHYTSTSRVWRTAFSPGHELVSAPYCTSAGTP